MRKGETIAVPAQESEQGCRLGISPTDVSRKGMVAPLRSSFREGIIARTLLGGTMNIAIGEPSLDFYQAAATLFFALAVAGVIETRLIDPDLVASARGKRRWGGFDVVLLVLIITLVVFGLIISLGGISGKRFKWGDRHETTLWLLAIAGGLVMLKVILRRLLEGGWLRGAERTEVNHKALAIFVLGLVTGLCGACGIVFLVYWALGPAAVLPLFFAVVFGLVMWLVASADMNTGVAAGQAAGSLANAHVANTSPVDLADGLARIAGLHQAGTLNDGEFAAAKSKILGT